ncbi:Srp19p [Mitosporidium daphniae]
MSPTAIVYPLYFDSKRSAGDGRKVALSRSIPSPKLAHLVTAAKKLNLQYSVQQLGSILPAIKDSELSSLSTVAEKSASVVNKGIQVPAKPQVASSSSGPVLVIKKKEKKKK